MRDASGLVGSWNFEIREYAGRLIQSMMYLGGSPVRCPDSWPLYAVLNQNNCNFTAPKEFSPTELVEIGRHLNTARIVQITTTRSGQATVAKAEAWEVSTGRSLGNWEASVPSERPTYESLFDVADQIAPKVAAGLCEIEESDLWKPLPDEPIAAPFEEVLKTLNLPTYPRLLKTFRSSLQAVETSPHSAEAWNSIAISTSLLATRNQKTETRVWRECILRALVSSSIANRLDPESHAIRFVHRFALLASGRVTQSMDAIEKDIQDDPENVIAKRFLDALSAKNSEVGDENVPDLFTNISDMILCNRLDATEKSLELLSNWLGDDPFAPDLLNYLGDSYAKKTELNHQRWSHTLASIQGAALALTEAVRQLELTENEKTAQALSETTVKLFRLKDVSPLPQTDPTPLANSIEAAFDGLDQEYWQEVTPWCCAWSPDSFPFKLLEAYSEILQATPVTSFEDATLRESEHGMGLTPYQWMRLAERPGLDAAADSFRDIAFGLGSTEALSIGNNLHELFPKDVVIMEPISEYHRDYVFNNTLVDKYQTRMVRIDPFYLPARRRDSTFKGRLREPGGREKILTATEQLKYLSPFNLRTLGFIRYRFESLGEYKLASDYANLFIARDPLNIDACSKAAILQAKAERRLLTNEEVETLINNYPDDYPHRDLSFGSIYSMARQFDKAIQHYERYLETNKPEDSGTYDSLSWLYWIQGEYDDALRTLEKYVERDPHSLATCNILLRKASVELSRANLQAASKEWQRAAMIDNWKGDVIVTGANLLWLNGKRDSAIREYARTANRYGSQWTYADMGWLHVLNGDLEEGLRCAEAGLRRNPSQEYCVWLKSEILRIQGKEEESLNVLRSLQRRMIDGADPLRLFADHYMAIGDYQAAAPYLKSARQMSLMYNRSRILGTQITNLIALGNFELARKKIALYESMEPLRVDSWYYRAKIAFKEKDYEKALNLLETPLKVGSSAGHSLTAQAYLALGRNEEALEHAQRATKWHVTRMPHAWLVLGLAAQANNDQELAESAFKECLLQDGASGVYGKQAMELM